MNWKPIALILGIAAVVVGWWWFPRPAPPDSSDRVAITASFYPLAFFAQQIGGERVSVTNLTPPGAEPHDFEPSTRDIALIENSQLLLLNGIGFEAWAQGLSIQNPEVRLLKVAEGLTAVDEGEAGVHGLDPHVWLDPVQAKLEVERIVTALSEIDPGSQVEYAANGAALTARLEALNSEFETGLSQCRQDSFVTAHAAFGSLAGRYGLNQVPIAGLSPDEEPTPRDLAKVAEFARANEIHYIFFETLVSPRLAETVAREIDAQALVLNPLEGLTNEEQSAGQDYFSIQRENLENLRTALDCI